MRHNLPESGANEQERALESDCGCLCVWLSMQRMWERSVLIAVWSHAKLFMKLESTEDVPVLPFFLSTKGLSVILFLTLRSDRSHRTDINILCNPYIPTLHIDSGSLTPANDTQSPGVWSERARARATEWLRARVCVTINAARVRAQRPDSCVISRQTFNET